MKINPRDCFVHVEQEPEAKQAFLVAIQRLANQGVVRLNLPLQRVGVIEGQPGVRVLVKTDRRRHSRDDEKAKSERPSFDFSNG